MPDVVTVTNDQAVEAWTKGIDRELYMEARALGSTHEEILSIGARSRDDLIPYINSREAGDTHDEARSAWLINAAPGAFWAYAAARKRGLRREFLVR